MTPFPQPIYVTRPLLPPLTQLTGLLEQVWASQWLTNGGEQQHTLERRLRDLLAVKELSLFNNGTIALITAIQALRLSGEVITTPFTFPATTHVLSWNGISPVFCDIDPQRLTIDAGKIEDHITPRTTGILAVHVYGIPCDVERIQAIADRHGLRVIYDAAHAFGATVGGRPIGAFGDVSMFSFHATKLFHTAEGGALVMSDDHLRRRIDLLKNFGIKNEEEVIMPGINGKMTELQAALGLAVLDHVPEEKRRRHALARLYIDRLSRLPGIVLHDNVLREGSSLQYFVIRIDTRKFGYSRDQLHAALKTMNVHARKYFHPLCSDYACYRTLPSASPENLPVAHRVVSEVLCLPFYGQLPLEDAGRICDMIEGFARTGSL